MPSKQGLYKMNKNDIVNVVGIGPMKFKGAINSKGDMTFFGRTGTRTISTITINKNNITIKGEDGCSFTKPYEIDKTHNIGSQREAYHDLSVHLERSKI